jgi:hypothetical protein
MADVPLNTPVLRLDSSIPKKELAKIRDNFSAIVLQDSHLWLGGDEGTSIDRLTRGAGGDFGNHTRFDLAPLLNLPGGGEEIDIEGLDVDGGYLWVIGSHSLKRKKADAGKTAAENIKRLASVSADGNRFTLARVPLDPAGKPVPTQGALTVARLHGDARGNALTDALKKDEHIGPFVPRVLPDGAIEGIPSKDNGLDVEGLAVSGNRVFLGLRGPVLRGWTVIVELRVTAGSGGVFKLQAVGAHGALIRRHFLQLEGLGVRDLVIHEKDLFVLAGPTMDLDGPVSIYRWSNALEQEADSLTFATDLKKVVSVPFGIGKDHAEGLTLVPGGVLAGMVCYDSPAKSRIQGANDEGVRADVFRLSA